MSFFTSADFTLGQKLLEIVYIIIGLLTIYTGVKNAQEFSGVSLAWYLRLDAGSRLWSMVF